MKFAIASALIGTASVAAADIEFREHTPCGDNYGWETCNWNSQDPQTAVIVCNDQHVWAIRDYCGGSSLHHQSHCCQSKAGGGAYCACRG